MRRKREDTHPAAREARPSRRIHEEAVAGKLAELAACPRCKASYRNGRWTWKEAPADAYEQLCPACERIEQDYPAGVLHVEGGFARAHRDELVQLLRNTEERERSRHPLKRIIAVSEEEPGLVVTVTDPKLTLSLGRALEKAYKGDLEHPPTTSDKENLVRVRWSRD